MSYMYKIPQSRARVFAGQCKLYCVYVCGARTSPCALCTNLFELFKCTATEGRDEEAGYTLKLHIIYSGLNENDTSEKTFGRLNFKRFSK